MLNLNFNNFPEAPHSLNAADAAKCNLFNKRIFNLIDL